MTTPYIKFLNLTYVKRMPPRDLCKGFRECYNAILRAIVVNPIIAGVCMGIPTYFLLSVIAFQESVLVFASSMSVRSTVSGPFFTLLTFTILAWIVELVGIRWKLPNLLNICAFGHAAVGSWWIVNLVILSFTGWYYVPFRLMFGLLSALIVPSIIWHITGDIIRAYKRKLVDDIENYNQTLAQQTELITDTDVGKFSEEIHVNIR
jgi:hypothetical protein